MKLKSLSFAGGSHSYKKNELENSRVNFTKDEDNTYDYYFWWNTTTLSATFTIQ
jgi:hypothetical protein